MCIRDRRSHAHVHAALSSVVSGILTEGINIDVGYIFCAYIGGRYTHIHPFHIDGRTASDKKSHILMSCLLIYAFMNNKFRNAFSISCDTIDCFALDFHEINLFFTRADVITSLSLLTITPIVCANRNKNCFMNNDN